MNWFRTLWRFQHLAIDRLLTRSGPTQLDRHYTGTAHEHCWPTAYVVLCAVGTTKYGTGLEPVWTRLVCWVRPFCHWSATLRPHNPRCSGCGSIGTLGSKPSCQAPSRPGPSSAAQPLLLVPALAWNGSLASADERSRSTGRTHHSRVDFGDQTEATNCKRPALVAYKAPIPRLGFGIGGTFQQTSTGSVQNVETGVTEGQRVVPRPNTVRSLRRLTPLIRLSAGWDQMYLPVWRKHFLSLTLTVND